MKCEPWPTVVSPVGLFYKHTAVPFLLRAWQGFAIILEPLVVQAVPCNKTTQRLPSTYQREVKETRFRSIKTRMFIHKD